MRLRKTILLVVGIIFNCIAMGQYFKRFAFDSIGITPYELYVTKEGVTHMTSSIGMWRLKGREFNGPSISNGVIYEYRGNPKLKIRQYTAEDSVRSMAQGADSIFYFVLQDNLFLWRPNGETAGWGWSPINFPKAPRITKLWIDDGNLYVGTANDNFFFIKDAARTKTWTDFKEGADKDSNYFAISGAKKIEQIIIQPATGVYSFSQDAADKNKVWLGTNRGLFFYDKLSGKTTAILGNDKNDFTITEIYTGEQGNIWFSTMEKGMGVYSLTYQTMQFYSYKKVSPDNLIKNSIKAFCYKSPGEFFVAIMDSLPAIFSTQSRSYLFFSDSVLQESPNSTTDVKVDRQGNLMILKGGSFYIADVSSSDLLRTTFNRDSTLLFPFIRRIELPDGIALATLDYNQELLKKITLKYNQNAIFIFFDVSDFSDEKGIQFAWKVDGYTNDWVVMPSINYDSSQAAFLQDLDPGKYKFQVKVRVGKGEWRKQVAEMEIIVKPAFWQTWWFWLSVLAAIGILIFSIVKLRVRSVRKQEQVKAAHEKQLLEFEAKALRAQMNPHFIFNCLNSIKSLIQEQQTEKGVTYLTTFSKLIRTLFNNADKKEITLYDEIETCKLYLQLEAMRFDTKFSYQVNVDENLDLKSVQIPALIIQPFIENAIWHGIMPKNGGGNVLINVGKKNGHIKIAIEDDGIGREASQQNKSMNTAHQSKGVNLTQARLELDNLLQQRQASLETIDQKDEKGIATGTKVIITIKEEI